MTTRNRNTTVFNAKPGTPGNGTAAGVPLKESVSGVRGIVGKSLTPELVLRYGVAFGAARAPGPIIVARDTRSSGLMYRDLLIGALTSTGCKVIDIGITPTPTALGAVLEARAQGGIIITASHNPSPWNGMKFVAKEGSFLTPEAMRTLVQEAHTGKGQLAVWDGLKSAICDPRAIDRHIARILKVVNASRIRQRKFTVALDSCNGAGSEAAPKLLKALGCRLVAINITPDGQFPRGPEPTPKNLVGLTHLVRRSKAVVGFAQDPDADRLSMVDENGVPLSEELTLALAVQHRLSQKKGPVAVNLSTSRMVDDVAQKAGVPVYRTPVGEVHVIQQMRRVKAVIGGEGNGGVIDPRVTWGRDSLVGMALTLEALAASGETISQLAAPLQRWTMIKRTLTLSNAQTTKILRGLKTKFRNARIEQSDGIRVDLPQGWLHLRPSNTEPVVRMFAEALTSEEAEDLLNRAAV